MPGLWLIWFGAAFCYLLLDVAGAPAGVLRWWTWGVLAGAVVLLVVAGVESARQIRAQRWRREGRCAVCGYDLRASADRCPECGTEQEPPTAK